MQRSTQGETEDDYGATSLPLKWVLCGRETLFMAFSLRNDSIVHLIGYVVIRQVQRAH